MQTLPRFHAFALLLLSLAGLAGGATSVTHLGITWTFDGEYAVGQFCTGDPWVVGPVPVVGIDPPSRADPNGHITHGSMVNPSNAYPRRQGYDNGISVIAYDPALNVAWGVSAARPLLLPPGSSLISTITYPDRLHRPQVKRASILTVLAEAPPEGSFRPPYCGDDKTVRFNKSMLNRALLKNLPHVTTMPALEIVEAQFAAPWVEHTAGWVGEMARPDLNMPHYGRELHTALGVGGLMLHMDFPPERKEKLLCGYVQVGIDYYAVVQANRLTWMADGGHMGGRKWPILFAGLMLNDPAMKAIGQKSGDYLYADGHGPGNPPEDYLHFGEDDQTHYVTQADVDVTNGPAWQPPVTAGVPKIPYGPNDIGLPEWGIKHAAMPETNNRALAANYRTVAGPPFHGTCLAALLTPGGKELWRHDVLFEYTDRYMAFTAPDGEYPGWWRSMSRYTAQMWDTYRARCGPIWPSTEWPSDPELPPIEDRKIVAGETLTFAVGAANPDLRISASDLPAGAEFAGGVFAWTPKRTDVGLHVVRIVSTNGVLADTATVAITVAEPPAKIVLGEARVELIDGTLRIEVPVEIKE